MIRLFRLFVLLAAALCAPTLVQAAPPDWTATAARLPSGSHLLGNPAAKVKLVEYISYTCPHCAHFHEQSEGPLKSDYIRSGKVAVEVRDLVRNPVDLAAALLASCGAPARFFGNHGAFLRAQGTWLEALSRSDEAQRKRWYEGSVPTRLRTIAGDLGFYQIIGQRGVTRAEADRCLGDETMVKQLTAQRSEAGKLGVTGTPSFLLDGVLLSGVHDWPSLEAQIKSRL